MGGVDQPPHYGGKDYPYQPIHVIEAWGLGFCLGTALKYIGRAGRKPGESRVKDLQKAIQEEVDAASRPTSLDTLEDIDAELLLNIR